MNQYRVAMVYWNHRCIGLIMARYTQQVLKPNTHTHISSLKRTCQNAVHLLFKIRHESERGSRIFLKFVLRPTPGAVIVNDTMSKHKEKDEIRDDKVNKFAQLVPKVT